LPGTEKNPLQLLKKYLEVQKTMNTLWYKNAIFYELNVRAFKDSNGDGCGDLRGVVEKIGYLKSIGMDCIWLLPIYPSPLKDDGYDIADYTNIHPDLGTIDDFKALITAAHEQNIKVVADLVLNHTSDQHAWFQAARQDRNSPYRDYYVWSDTDQKFADARIIFLDTETSNWTWDEVAGQYYWHRFYSSQPDLNYRCSRLKEEIFNVVSFWLDLGIDGFRADAVPYLFEEEGTNCENLPETHQFLKELRHFIDQNYPGKVLLCEANQWPEDVRQYFGDGDEFHMGFHFPVMPRIFMALRQENRKKIVEILDQTPEIPAACQWCIFLRNHDELTLEMVTEEERQWMWNEYAPDKKMRLNLGIRRRLAPLLDNDQRKLELINSLLFTLPGSPFIYYGDEIGMGDNLDLPDRNGVRTPMQWDDTQNAGFSDARHDQLYAPVISSLEYGPQIMNVSRALDEPASLLNCTRRMIEVRKQNPAFGQGKFSWAELENDGLAAYWRTDGENSILVIQNLTGIEQTGLAPEQIKTAATVTELISGKPFICDQKLILQPYEYLWLQI
jgi:maltose alpha-D-glucosyltransferase/alpha-amylase